MSEPRIKPFKVNWDQFFKGVEDLETAPRSDPLINKIVVYPEIIPIIFVPGIMGSRLIQTGSGKNVWDPDSISSMVKNYGFNCPPDKRKNYLVGEASHNDSHLTVNSISKKVAANKRDHNWAGVAYRYYGDILEAMGSHQWPFPLNICFKFPVYAFGYNWTDSNLESGRKLAEYIEAVIAKHTWTTCRRVILVTHSMGGLVSRAACKLHGAESRVLGIVHGTQPTTGS
ncbi:MAG: hypothetical protein KFF50_14165, partial [Desulfatitalea sp.]|nr:hypothetical protein [Desulfatitalea sp.]